MKKFEEPKFELITLASPDVITTSGGFDYGVNNNGYTNTNTKDNTSLDDLFSF